MDDTTYKTTAIALQNRRLATVTRKRGVWKAEATEAGRHFAEHGSYPAGHWTSASDTSGARSAKASSPARPTIPARAERKVTALRPVDQMIADIVAAGGRLEVEDFQNYYDNLVSSAIRHGKVPEGKLLEIVRRSWPQRVLRLVDKPAWMTAALEPIEVSDRLIKPHSAIVALRADKQHRLRFKPDVRQRALRLLDAIARSASARGWELSCPARNRDDHHPSDLAVSITGHTYGLRVSENDDKVPHEPTAKELRDFERWGYPRIPTYDKVPSGRLTISIDGGVPVRQSAFSDTKTMNLDDRLPVLVQELELRAAAAEQRRLEREQQEAERRRRWQQVRDEAVIALREHNRATTLAEQAAQWHQNLLLGDYIAAMQERVASLDGDEQAAAREWVEWAKERHQQSNPLNQRLALPADPDPSPEAIKPYMRGLSPYGPDNGFGWR
ncbi:hypothetical protein ACIBG5_10970 [Kribbella sp. NPDC050241]|uniref:hypothetical protein n=1 Tax=Kribbella sp. NPDC050241 TaxID=3364115 RepID=UPI0037A33AF7